jgi:hypothetical protein
MFFNEPGGFVGGSTENESPIIRKFELVLKIKAPETYHGPAQRRDRDPGVMQVLELV